jgi:hypothetical protein
MKLIVGSTIIGLWRDILLEAKTVCAAELPEELEAYIIFLLIRYTNKPEVVKSMVATQLLVGMELTVDRREVVLQEVGDKCLIFSGLFPGLAEKRLVKIGYYVNLGRGAYFTISHKNNDLYARLSRQFVAIMDILQSIRQQALDFPDLLPFQAYDLWNETGSKRALKVLKQYTNADPLKVELNAGSSSRYPLK